MVKRLLFRIILKDKKKKAGFFPALVLLILCNFFFNQLLAQNKIAGDFSGGDWATGTTLSASLGTSLIYTKSGVGSTGNKYFRMRNNSNQEMDPGASDFAITGNNSEITTMQIANSKAWYINVPNGNYIYLFKTLSATSMNFIAFEIQDGNGGLRTLGVPSQSPTSGAVTAGTAVTVTSTLSGTNALSAGQLPYIRYSTSSSFTTSTVTAMSVSGTTTLTATGTIPSGINTAGTTVYYYIFMSGDGTNSLSPSPPSNGARADLFTFSAQGSSSSPSSYTVLNPATITSTTSGNWNSGSTWVGGVIPASGDNVVIANGNTVTLDANKTVSSLTINSGGTFNGGSGSNTLTVSASGTIANAGTYTANTETISFSSSGTINGTNPISINNLTINAGTLTLTTVPTVTGTFQINSGNISTALNYGSSSTLKYNTTYTRFNEWTNATSQPGYPANVQVSNNSTLTLKPAAGTSSAKCSGNLTIDAGSTITMSDMTNTLTVAGDFSCSGTYTMSTQTPGDLQLGGNLTRSATSTWTNNLRSVMLNGTGNQTIAYTGGGTWQFDYLSINKASGNMVMSNSPATNIQLQQTSGNVLTIKNLGGLDLNGQTMTLGCTGGCNGGNLLVDGVNGIPTGSVVSSLSGGTMRIQGNSSGSLNKTVTSANGGTLTFASTAILALTNCDFNPGSGLTTINSEADIESGGDFITNAPTYGTGSTLKFKTGVAFNLTTTQKAWVSGSSGAGVPYNVYIEDNAGNNGNRISHQMGTSNPAYVRNNLTIDGLFELSNTNGPNIVYIGGNYTQLATSSIDENSGKVVFYGGPSGNNSQVIDVSVDADPDGLTLYDVEINQSGGSTVSLLAGVTLNMLTVTHSLVLTKGYLVLNDNLAIINSGATHSGASTASFVVTNYVGGTTNIGCLKKISVGTSSSFVFPIGPSTTSYNPLTFEASASHTSDNISARVLVGVAPTSAGYSNAIAVSNTALFVDRTWEIFEGTAGGTNGDITMQWNASHENGSFTRASDQVYHYTGGAWVNVLANTRLGSDPYTVRAGAVTSFSPFIVGSIAPYPLPINLLSFNGAAVNDGNYLEWTTASETNNDYFTLERSIDGENFTFVASHTGANNSNQLLDYHFLDTTAFEGNFIYYRLKQTDYDGKYTYSSVIVIKKSAGTEIKLTDLYVDEHQQVVLNLTNPKNILITIEVTDMLGRILLRESTKQNGMITSAFLKTNVGHFVLIKIFTEDQCIIRKLVY